MRTRLLTLAALVAVLTITATALLPAQAGPRLGQEQVGLRPPASREMIGREPPDLRVPRQTQWVKGGVIGGVVGALLGFLTVSAVDGISDSGTDGNDRLRGVAIGAGLGFLIGALVGGQFEKN